MIVKELTLNFFKRNGTLSLTVGIFMAMIMLLLVTIFPDMPAENAVAVSHSWPQIMKDLFGDPMYGFTNIYGWIYLQIYHITYWLVVGLLGAILASKIVAKEVEENTVDILLSYPVSRSELIISRIISVVITLVILTIVMIATCSTGVVIAGYPLHLDLIVRVSVAGFFLSMIFASVSLFISIWTSQQTLSVFITLGIMGFFFMYEEVLAKLYVYMGKLSFLNPFHYYQPGNILIHRSFSVLNHIVLVIYALIFLFFSIISFQRKDIT